MSNGEYKRQLPLNGKLLEIECFMVCISLVLVLQDKVFYYKKILLFPSWLSFEAREIQLQRFLLAYPAARLKSDVFMCCDGTGL